MMEYRPGLEFLVIRLDGLGDVVMTTGLFRELKQNFPQSSCTVIAQPSSCGLLNANAHIEEVIPFPILGNKRIPHAIQPLFSSLLLYWRLLRGRRFDVVIVPRWDLDYHYASFLCALTRAEVTVGFTEKTTSQKKELNKGFDKVFSICLPAGPLQHEVLRVLEIIPALGGKIFSDRLDIHIHEDDEIAAAHVFPKTSAPIIALGIGAQDAKRRWPIEFYAQTIDLLRQKRDVSPVIICSQVERSMAMKLANLLSNDVHIFSGYELPQVSAILKFCDLLICNDSGIGHLAGGVNCQMIVISAHPANGDPSHFNSPVRIKPYSSGCHILQPEKGQDNCRIACEANEPHCILQITPFQVATLAFQLIENLLSEGR